MKLYAGLLIACSLLAGGEKLSRPEPFLKKGNTIRYVLSGKSESSETHRMALTLTIVNVTEKNGTSLISGLMAYYSEKMDVEAVYRMNYSCDSLRFYASTLNWCYRSAGVTPDIFYEDKGDSLEYPLKMTVGDSLRGGFAVHKVTTKQNTSTTKYDFATRKVVSLDTVETPFGKIEAYLIQGRVTMTSKSKYSGTGKGAEFDYTFEVSEWFSPSAGIVKSEYSIGSGFNRCVMESYSK